MIFVYIVLGFCIFGIGATISCPISEKITKTYNAEHRVFQIGFVISIILGIGTIFTCISVSDGIHRDNVARYEAQKQTIEYSLANDDLTGLERFELVKIAIELNKDITDKKVRLQHWYNPSFDKSIYDNVELIDLGGK